MAVSSREAWGKFQSWLIDVHPRARNQSALIAELMGSETLTFSVPQLQEAIWELGKSPDSDEIFKREDRFRRLLSDLRRNIAEYNRLTPGDGRLILAKRGRADGTLSLGMTEPTQTGFDEEDLGENPCRSHDVLSGTETMVASRWALLGATPTEGKRLARWLTDEIAESQSYHSDGPEWRGESLIRHGSGHDVERLVRLALPEADERQRWRLIALWGEAFDAVSGLCQIHDFLEEQFHQIEREGLQSSDPQAYFRIARLLVRSIAQGADNTAEFEEHIEAFVSQAYDAGRPSDAHTLQAYHLHRVLGEAFERDRPALLPAAMRQLRQLLEKTADDPDHVQLHVRTIYWIGRARMAHDLTEILNESRPILRELADRCCQRTAAMIQSYQVHLLCQAGEWTHARAISCPNVCRRIQYADRSGVIFPLRDLEHILRASRNPPGQDVFEALALVRGMLCEIVKDYACRFLRPSSIRPVPKAFPAERLQPLSDLLPWVFEADWKRLLMEAPPTSPL